MKCILIPVEFNSATQNVLSYVISFCKDVPVEHIILFKSFHLPFIAKVLPDANYVDAGNENYIEETECMRVQLDEITESLKKLLPTKTTVEKYLIDDKWLPAIERLIELKKPELVILGNDPHAELNDGIIAEHIVPFAKATTVSVLVVPVDAVYKKLNRVLIPTTFENLDRLRLIRKINISNNWLHATMFVLNIDPKDKYKTLGKEHRQLLNEYLQGYHYQVTFSGANDIVKGILSFAKKSDVQLIMALPGKHSFLYRLTHHSITETFALNAHHPVLLLK